MSVEQERERRNLYAELFRLAERNENLTRYVEVIERKIDALFERAGAASITVAIEDSVPPLEGGAALDAEPRDGEEPFYSCRPAATLVSEEYRPEASWWPRPGDAERPLMPTAGWRNYSLHKRTSKVVGISVCGMSRSVLEATVSAIADQQDRLRDFVPVFLTDSTEFDVFRRYGYVWEYFPGPVERARYQGTMSWVDYAAARRRLLMRKWNLDRVVCIGPVEFGVIGDLTGASDATGLSQADG